MQINSYKEVLYSEALKQCYMPGISTFPKLPDSLCPLHPQSSYVGLSKYHIPDSEKKTSDSLCTSLEHCDHTGTTHIIPTQPFPVELTDNQPQFHTLSNFAFHIRHIFSDYREFVCFVKHFTIYNLLNRKFQQFCLL